MDKDSLPRKHIGAQRDFYSLSATRIPLQQPVRLTGRLLHPPGNPVRNSCYRFDIHGFEHHAVVTFIGPGRLT
jgi:hypothetical protein